MRPYAPLWKTLAFVFLLLIAARAGAQRMFINSTDSIYEIVGAPGNYTAKNLGRFGIPQQYSLFSMAMHKDTLYAMTSSMELFRIVLSTGAVSDLGDLTDPASPLGVFQALTCDKNGILYAMSGPDVYRYDPHVNSLSYLGRAPDATDGDLVFYGDTLLCATGNSTIEAIDIANPSASYTWMDTPGYGFFGLLEMPDNCSKNRLFGIDWMDPCHMIELDPIGRTVTGVVGQFPTYGFDACSTAENGSINGVMADSLSVGAVCDGQTGGAVQVYASSAADGGTTYTLDGTVTNSTGIFPAVPAGAHTVHIDAGPGCTTDSPFVVYKGLSGVGYAVVAPKDCTDPASGSIQVMANSQATPILYSIDGGLAGTSPVFDTLHTGLYTLVVTDAGHCEKDTAIALSYQHILAFPGQLTVTPTLCAEQNGNISLALSGTLDPSIFYAALNNGANQTVFSFPRLDSGTYILHIGTTTGCRFDTTVSIIRKIDPEPVIQADITDQRCFTDNGSIRLSVSGTSGPYLGSFDNKAYVSDLYFDTLAPATYTIRIQDENTCVWDTSFIVRPYQKDTFTMTVDTTHPVCTSLNSGSLKVTVQGTAPPYLVVFGNTTYPNGSLIGNLPQGDYALPIINGEGCAVDTVHSRLNLVLKPECNKVYLPDAFTPDGNGTNDLFRVLHNPYLTTIRLKVYNRYGGLVFSSSADRPGWDGTFQGKPQPAGVYVWEADYTDLTQTARTAHGTVLLIR